MVGLNKAFIYIVLIKLDILLVWIPSLLDQVLGNTFLLPSKPNNTLSQKLFDCGSVIFNDILMYIRLINPAISSSGYSSYLTRYWVTPFLHPLCW
jgi:hypothetical protein